MKKTSDSSSNRKKQQQREFEKEVQQKREMVRNFKPTCGKCGWIRVSPTRRNLYIDRECKEHMQWAIEFTYTKEDREKYI